MSYGFLVMYLVSALTAPFEKWIAEDAVYIITSQERMEWVKLRTNAKRELFIAAFWSRRDPGFKDEHYRRVAYANEHFAVDKIPGWRTDRGRIYITLGPPDKIESHPSGDNYVRPPEEGGGSADVFPFELWHYKAKEAPLEFVDTTMSGNYRLVSDR
jgi:GWxTD domain-containing protein